MNHKNIMAAISVIAISLSARPIKNAETGKKVPPANPTVAYKVAEITTVSNRDTIAVKTADATPKLQTSHGYFSVSGLLWNILTDAQDIAINEVIEDELAYYSSAVNVQTESYGLNYGAKASLGYRCKEDEWDVALHFAYLQASKTLSNTIIGNSEESGTISYVGNHVYPESGVLQSLAFTSQNDLNPNTPYGVTTFSQANKFHYYDGALNMCREYFISKKLSLRPLAGVKGSVIQQRSDINFTYFFTDTETLGTLDIKNDYWGVGPQFGSGIRFGFTKHFSFDCQVDGSVLWGKILNTQNYNNQNPPAASGIIYPTIAVWNADRYQIVPNVNILAGFVIDYNYNKNKANIKVNLSYENRYYFNNIGTAASAIRQKGSTSMQGATVGLTFSY